MSETDTQELTLVLTDHGDCEAINEHGCTGPAVAIAAIACAPAPSRRLVCVAAEEYIRRAHEAERACERCHTPTRECWTVVRLP